MKIKEIILQVNSFYGIKSFYIDVLGLSVFRENNNKISFEAGTSILTFIQSDEHHLPYYHFAFNITENKDEQALKWLKNSAIKINQINGQDVYYDKTWNSHSIYFYDTSGNIVELIARHNVPEAGQGDFSSIDIKNISEIGLPVVDVHHASEVMQNKYSLDVYRSSNDVFAPLGDEEGLFILSGLNRKWVSSDKEVKIFPLIVDIYSTVERIDCFLDNPYTIRTGYKHVED